MLGRTIIAVLALVLGAAAPVGAMVNGEAQSDELARREEETLVLVSEDDDVDGEDTTDGGGGGTDDGFTSGGNSNDATNSRHTPVSQDRDRSAGDLTRDRTRDGAGGPRRDWSPGQTNDRSRNDSR